MPQKKKNNVRWYFMVISGILILLFIWKAFDLALSSKLISFILFSVIVHYLGRKLETKKWDNKKKMEFSFSSLINKFEVWQLIALFVLFLFFIFFFRPWFHGVIMLFYTIPALILFGASVLIISYFYNKKSIRYLFTVISVISLIIIILNPFFVESYITKNTKYTALEKLPSMSTENLRLLPRAVAQRYLVDSLQTSNERLGDFDIIKYHGNLAWSAPRIPGTWFLSFLNKISGVHFVNARSMDRDVIIQDQYLTFGEETRLFDSIYWQLYKKKFFVDIDNIYYVINNNQEILTIAQIIKYKFVFPTAVPYFSGSYVITPTGEIKEYSASELLAYEPLKGNMIYPESLARLYVESYEYKDGLFNRWFLHEDQIEISDVAGQLNQQPFLIDTDNGLKWFIGAEPFGRAHGVFKIFLVDAATGDIELWDVKNQQTLTGHTKAAEYVASEIPIATKGSLLLVLEPRPIFIRNKLFWLITLTPRDYAGVHSTVLVDAATNEIHHFTNDMDLIGFIDPGVIRA